MISTEWSASKYSLFKNPVVGIGLRVIKVACSVKQHFSPTLQQINEPIKVLNVQVMGWMIVGESRRLRASESATQTAALDVALCK